jgi:hypothetical protein
MVLGLRLPSCLAGRAACGVGLVAVARGLSGRRCLVRVVSAWALVRVLLVGFKWRDTEGASRINVRF